LATSSTTSLFAPSLLAAETMRTSTSIYRQHTGLVYAVADPLDRINRDESAGPQASVDFARQRRALPIAILLPNTQKWLDALPRSAQPHALCAFYPRIANLIAAMWVDMEGLGSYFDELLVDRRPGRRGFPLDVINDLRVLRDYRAALHPCAMFAGNNRRECHNPQPEHR
jgi:hypothetical protein